jgi:hypothetical protein
MSFDMIKVNATHVAQRFAAIATQTLNGATTIVSGAVNGVKGIGLPVAHGTLLVTAEAADLAYKSVLIAGPFSSVLLMADAYAFSKGNPLFSNICGKSSPIFALHRASVGQFTESAGQFTAGSSYCKDITPEELKGLPSIQGLVGLMLMVVATPIVALTFRKINQLAIKLNNSF